MDFTGSAVSGSGPASALQLTTSGTYGGATDFFPSSAAFAVEVDDINLTLTYSSIAVQVPGFTTSNTVLFNAGLGQTTSVTTSITFDAFTILYTGTQALALTATTGGNYTIAAPTILAFGSLALSGHYSVTGPTQTVTGNFATPSFAVAGNPSFFRWATFNSIGYPATSQLVSPVAGPSSLKPHWGIFGSIIDETVDGAHVTASLGTATIAATGYGALGAPVALTAVPTPEPASAALLGLGALLLGARRRRGA